MAENFKALLPAQAAAGATAVTTIGIVSTTTGTDNVLSRVVLTPPNGYSTSTHHATNNVTFNINRVRAAASTPVAVLTTTTVDLVAETPVAVPLTGTAAQLSSLQQDDMFECQMVQNASGVTVGANILCEVELS
jgi:hypothetical protein